MTIQVLGSGCPSCKSLFELTKKVTKELKIDTEVEYITDVSKMIEIGVMTSPVLAINNKPVLTGGNKSEEEIKNALSKNLFPKGREDNGCCPCSCGCNC